MAREFTNPNPTQNPGGIEVTFDNPVLTKKLGVHEIKRTTITIKRFVDNPSRKVVGLFTDDNKFYELWTGAEYDSIGDWTSEQAVNKLKELVLAGNTGK